jgi:hypothetical protein
VELPAYTVATLVGLVIGAIVAISVPGRSRRRNRIRARNSGAQWVGLANVDALDDSLLPAVRRALSSVGSYYGERLAGRRISQRPVGGLLFVFADRVHWEPRIWLGRGHAESWVLKREKVTSADVTRLPLPALRSFIATIRTEEGSVRMTIVDPDGFMRALSPTAGRSPRA